MKCHHQSQPERDLWLHMRRAQTRPCTLGPWTRLRRLKRKSEPEVGRSLEICRGSRRITESHTMHTRPTRLKQISDILYMKGGTVIHNRWERDTLQTAMSSAMSCRQQ